MSEKVTKTYKDANEELAELLSDDPKVKKAKVY